MPDPDPYSEEWHDPMSVGNPNRPPKPPPETHKPQKPPEDPPPKR